MRLRVYFSSLCIFFTGWIAAYADVTYSLSDTTPIIVQTPVAQTDSNGKSIVSGVSSGTSSSSFLPIPHIQTSKTPQSATSPSPLLQPDIASSNCGNFCPSTSKTQIRLSCSTDIKCENIKVYVGTEPSRSPASQQISRPRSQEFVIAARNFGDSKGQDWRCAVEDGRVLMGVDHSNGIALCQPSSIPQKCADGSPLLGLNSYGPPRCLEMETKDCSVTALATAGAFKDQSDCMTAKASGFGSPREPAYVPPNQPGPSLPAITNTTTSTMVTTTTTTTQITLPPPNLSCDSNRWYKRYVETRRDRGNAATVENLEIVGGSSSEYQPPNHSGYSTKTDCLNGAQQEEATMTQTGTFGQPILSCRRHYYIDPTPYIQFNSGSGERGNCGVICVQGCSSDSPKCLLPSSLAPTPSSLNGFWAHPQQVCANAGGSYSVDTSLNIICTNIPESQCCSGQAEYVFTPPANFGVSFGSSRYSCK